MKFKRTHIVVAVAALLIFLGAYTLAIALAPTRYQSTTKAILGEQNLAIPNDAIELSFDIESQIKPNQLLVPKIGLQVAILQGSEKALNYGSWNKFPERGAPTENNNFVLTGHRFGMGFTPQGTRQKSPFYNIDKLNVGDEIVVVWADQEHIYKISKITTVNPEDVWVEGPSTSRKLTLYTCTLKGHLDGRVVIEALPI